MSDDEARALVKDLSARTAAYGETLMHYASPYYDPVKAKEYYEKTKQLKGRPTGTASASLGISKPKQRSAPAPQPAKDAIQAKRDARLAELKGKAEETRKKIAAKLEARIAELADQALKRIENLPEGTDPDIVKRLMASHSKNANKARAQARTEMAGAAKSIRTAIAKARTDYSNERSAAAAKKRAAKPKKQGTGSASLSVRR